MSDSAVNLVGGVVGAVIGFYAGGPAGAAQGFATGYSLTAAATADPTQVEQEGPRLEDLAVQSSSYGQPIPHVYGTFPVAGNVIWLENNRIEEVKTTETEEHGGKGGGGVETTTTTYTYYATFALSLCEGPIRGIRRVWANGRIIYTAAEDVGPNEVLGGARVVGDGTGTDEPGRYGRIVVYTGTETQNPDPRIEADRGTVPAWRGLAYIVVEDLELSDFGQRIPQLQVEVVQPDETLQRPQVIASHTIDREAVFGNANYSATDWVRIEQDTVVFNLNPDNATAAVADGDGARDYRFSFGLDFLGSEPNPHTDLYYVGDGSTRAPWFLGRFGQWTVNGGITGDRVYVSYPGNPSSVDAFWGLIHTQFNPADEDADDVGAAISADGRHLVVFWPGATDAIYRIYAADSFAGPQSWIERGTLPHGGVIRFNGAEVAPAIESDLSRIWIVTNGDVHLYERNSDSQFVLAGSVDNQLPSANEFCAIADRGLCAASADQGLAVYTAQITMAAGGIALQDIVEDLADRAGIAANDIDTTGLTNTVRGCAVARPMPLRQGLDPLRKAFPFDTVEQGYQIRFQPRGGSVVATLTDEDLAAREPGQEQPAVLNTSREQEIDLPRRIRVRHRSVERDYEFGTQYAGRLATDSEHIEQVDLPLVLNAQEAAEVADVLLRERWAVRDPMEGATHWGQLGLEAGDLVTLDTSAIAGTARITRIDDGRPGLRQLQLVPDQPGLYSSDAIGVATAVPSEGPSPAGPTALALMDLPALRDADDGAGFYVAMGGYLDGWRGAQLLMSPNDSQYAAVTAATDDAVMGRTTAALADGPVGIWDRANSVNVRLVGGGTLSSVTEREVLDGANTFAIAAGEGWEILQAADITLESDGSYTLATLLRGRRGTEWATGDHAEGDRVVALSADSLSRVPRTVDSIDSERFYKPVSIGTAAGRVDPVAFTYAGVNLKPYSPVHPGGSRSGGDLTIRWTRRTRIGGAWRDRVGVPLSENTESYEVDVLDGSTAVRTLTTGSPSVTYTASQQQTDFGAVQSAVTVRIYQMSATVGRGYPLEATL